MRGRAYIEKNLVVEKTLDTPLGKGSQRDSGNTSERGAVFTLQLWRLIHTHELGPLGVHRIIWGDSEKGKWSYSPSRPVTGSSKQADWTGSKESLHFRLPFGVVELNRTSGKIRVITKNLVNG